MLKKKKGPADDVAASHDIRVIRNHRGAVDLRILMGEHWALVVVGLALIETVPRAVAGAQVLFFFF